MMRGSRVMQLSPLERPRAVVRVRRLAEANSEVLPGSVGRTLADHACCNIRITGLAFHPSCLHLLAGLRWCHIGGEATSGMREIRPPDAIGMAVLGILIALILLMVVAPVANELGLRLILSVCGQIVVFCITVLWWTTVGIRLWAFRCYYRFFGPNCQVRILGNIPVNPTRDDKDLLDGVFRITRSWKPEAERVANMRNRNVIRAGARTLTVDTIGDVVKEGHHGREDDGDRYSDEAREDNEYPANREVAIDLGGYEGKLTQLDSLLEHEVSYLLGRFSGDIKREDAQSMFSLRATIHGKNPFLTFYLRSVPSASVKDFRLSFTEGEAEDQVVVNVAFDHINISARTPTKLLESTRRFLASPALA